MLTIFRSNPEPLTLLCHVLITDKCMMDEWAVLCIQSLQRFMVTDLSNFYLDITKDRLYVRGTDSHDRRACQTVLASLLQVSFFHSCHVPDA